MPVDGATFFHKFLLFLVSGSAPNTDAEDQYLSRKEAHSLEESSLLSSYRLEAALQQAALITSIAVPIIQEVAKSQGKARMYEFWSRAGYILSSTLDRYTRLVATQRSKKAFVLERMEKKESQKTTELVK